jgi:hypothetical protein
MSLRVRIANIAFGVASEVAARSGQHVVQRQNAKQECFGVVIAVEGATATVQLIDGSTATGIIDQRTVVPGDTASVVGGRIM